MTAPNHNCRVLKDRIRAGSDPGTKIYGELLEILPDLDPQNAHDLLLEEAFRSSPVFPERVLRAIKSLWKLDPDAMLRAAELALERVPPLKEQLPKLLIQLAGERAIDLLCRHASRENTTAARWHIARALRLVSDSKQLDQHLREMLSDQDRRTREAAAEISGWQPPGFMRVRLETLARGDLHETLARKALEALQRQEEQCWVEQLRQEFRSDTSRRRWSLLTSMLKLGDPDLLTEPGDPLWIWGILDGTPPEYWEFAMKELTKRRQMVFQQLQSMDRRNT